MSNPIRVLAFTSIFLWVTYAAVSAYEELREYPSFVGHVENYTVRAGNSVILICQVKNLGNYKVAWVRVDTQTILTIHHHIITRNQRVSLSHHDNQIWRLHLEHAEESDRGWYMCQINTDPMRSQKGFLDVVVPPTIIDERTSSDVVVKEGNPVNLTCEATGSPKPQMRWRRADGELIRYQGGNVVSVDGSSLLIPSASRVHIGTYYCIASNGVPPTKSKSIMLRVQFAPMVWIENQLEFAPVGANITLSCKTEAFPPALHFWTFSNGSAVSTGPRYLVHQSVDNLTTRVTLTILRLEKSDFDTFYCMAKNSLGQQDGAIKLSERILPSTLPTSKTTTTSIVEQFYNKRTTKRPLVAINYDPFLPKSDKKRKKLDESIDRLKEKQDFREDYRLLSDASSPINSSVMLSVIIISFALLFKLI